MTTKDILDFDSRGNPYLVNETEQVLDASQIIDRLGGTSATAALCEIKPASVSEWRHSGIPKARLMYLKLLYPLAFDARWVD